ncbi:glutamate decarboxylase [Facilibium subflavum]|uniref:glutamate decarboxylase n=1 Tax=Facilibium subflavum TaxID=2219058 RepID=UPI000E653C30|nr:glutamate decarboxylase [Facilibium subflavum]
MIHKKSQKNLSIEDISTYAGRYDLDDITLSSISECGMPAKVAKQLIEDELNLDGTPILNLASFVTTWMEPEANDLIVQSLNKNFIDHDEYPQVEKLHERCVHILAELLNAPENQNYVGTGTIGSSEAIMLAGLAHKFSWRNQRKKQGKDASKPNIIMGSNVQICWDKFARYFDVEPKIIPMHKDRYHITAEDVRPLIDENTICVATILGTTFTGEYDEIEEINQLLLETKKHYGWDIPLHVDAASGGFISIFQDDKIKWDFQLEQVKSINLSGHKYGLVYPGIGWLIFKDESVIPNDLVFNVNYLGGNMPTYTLNFSRGSSMVVAQYYNFLRLGKQGYTRIVNNMMAVSNYLSQALTQHDRFSVLGTRRMEPVVTFVLNGKHHYDAYDISEQLRIYGWVVPAYSMPENAQDIIALRVVVKENFSLTLAQDFLSDLDKVIKKLDNSDNNTPQTHRHGKNIPH